LKYKCCSRIRPLASGTEANHLGQQLAGFLDSQRLQVDELLHSLDVRHLVGIEQAAAQLCETVSRHWVCCLHWIGNEDDGRLQ